MPAARKTGFDEFLEQMPRRAEFTIDMVADSTTEVWADIDTGLDDAQAWLLYGLEFGIYAIDPTVPLLARTANTVHTIQIQRNTESAILLATNNNRMMTNFKTTQFIATEGAFMYQEPWKVPIQNVTLQPTLRVLFRTNVDDTAISDAAYNIEGVILYDIITAPKRLASKIGTLTDL